MSSKINLQTCEYACKSSIFQDNQLIYIKLKNLEERTRYIAYMKERGVQTVFHYVPLHSAPAGLKFGRFSGIDKYTTKESERLVRLPLYYGLNKKEIDMVIQGTQSFFQEEI